MDVESQISEVKPIENNTINTINSSNYIYQKAIIKDNYEKMVNELRSLNFENIANNKMHHMNFNFLINSIINIKKTINKNNPFMKYIKYVKPYNINNSKVNIKNNKNKLLLTEKNNIKIKKIDDININLKEKIINFNRSKKNLRNFYFTRMCNIEHKKINTNITDKIILLQKNIRGYLSKKIVDEYINNEIAKNIIDNILTIQRAIRKFLLKKKSLDKLIINIIKNERNNKGNKITDIFSLYHYRNLYKKHLIIKKIVITRYKSASLIQSKFKAFILQRKVEQILQKEKKSYILTYPFSAENVKIKIYMDELNTYKIYNYFICPIRNYFITYIDKKSLEPGEYLCHIIVNDNIKIDKRYKYTDRHNILYNLIPFGNYLIKRKKPKQIEIEIEKKNKEIKKQKDKDKKINDELENFYIYYYNNDNNNNNNNSNSYNSYSNSEQENNKLNYRNQIDDDDPDQVIDISNQMYKSKLNNYFLNSNYKYIKKNYKIDKKKTGKNKKKDIKKDILNMKYKLKENLKMEANNNTGQNLFQYKLDILGSKDDEDKLYQSQSLNYNNILDELSQSANSVVSNISVRNINFYSKQTHEAKFTNGNKKKKKAKKGENLNKKSVKKNKNISTHKDNNN